MDWTKILTPGDTEEVRPGLFIQKRNGRYRKINPIAWNGKVDYKTQLKSIFSIRTIFTIALIAFIWFSYLHDFKELTTFYEETMGNPEKFCMEVSQQQVPLEVNNGPKIYPPTLQDNPS